MALHIDMPSTGPLPRRPTVSTDTDSVLSLGSRAKPDALAPKGHIVGAEDGTPLLLRRWLPDKPARAQLLLVHDYLDYGGRFAALAQALVAQKIGCHALDLRGHGISSGPRGYVRTLTDYSDDIQAGLNALPPGPQFLLGVGHSGLCVLDFAAQRRPTLQGVIAVEPPVDEGPPAPRWQKAFLQVVGRLFPRARVPTSLWPNVCFEPVALPRPVFESAVLSPLLPKHMTYAWWRDVPRIQYRVGRMPGLHVPLLFVEDAESMLEPTHPSTPAFLVGPKKKVRRLQVSQAAARMRAGEADAAIVDAVTRFIRRQLPKPALGPLRSSGSGSAATPTTTAVAPVCRAWCERYAEWPAAAPLVARTSMPGAYPQ